jgi:hypothetical protein
MKLKYKKEYSVIGKNRNISVSEKYEVTIFNFFQIYCTAVATPCDQYLNFITDHTKITNRKAECRLKMHTEMCLWKDVFIAIEI